MNELLFQIPVFRPGINVTVRNGPKWAFLVAPGDKVIIKDTQNKVQLSGLIVMVKTLKFDDIPEVWLRYEHDPSCQTLDGLQKAMHNAYGDVFGPDVTVIFFEVIG